MLWLMAALAGLILTSAPTSNSGWVSTAVADASVLGQWSAVQTWPVQATHSHLLPTGKVLFYPAWSQGDTPYIWDPNSGTIVGSALPGYNIFCSGHAFLPDGRLFVAGGHIATDVGMPHASIYDPFDDSWTQLPDMNAGRWYPSSTTLSTGDVLVLSGEENLVNGSVVWDPLPQVWQTSSGSWRDLTGAQMTISEWYPFMYAAPNGKVFEAGPAQMTQYLDPTGSGAWTTVGSSGFGERVQGSSVMYDSGKVMVLGGADPPTASTETIDLNGTTPAWRSVASMAQPRRQANATVLPDGKVLVTGGSSGGGFDNSSYPVYAAEEWDPATQQWTTLASDSVYRGYHSSALLLPDGRVLAAGGEIGGASAELYSPPYLFAGSRPTISAAPPGVVYGQTFSVQTPDAASITNVNWIRLGSVTHAFDESQRLNHLNFVVGSGSLNVTAPSSTNTAPPGYYMLFVLNGSGVPSVASIIQLGDAALPAAPSGLTATTPLSSDVALSWTDNSSNESGFSIERSTDGGSTFTQIGTVGPNDAAYADTAVLPSTPYQYRVRAYNAAGVSAYSNSLSVITPAARYNFEDGTLQGWWSGGSSASNPSNSQAAAYDGTHSFSLTLSATTQSNWGSGYIPAPNSMGPGTAAAAWVFVPPTGAPGLNAQLYLQDAKSTWFNAPTLSHLNPGVWTRLSWTLPTGVVTPVRWFGVWFGTAGTAWSGTVYIDSVDLTTSSTSATATPTPTATPLRPTATPTASATPSATVTPTASATPTATVTPTASVTPTPTATPTVNPLPAAPGGVTAKAASGSEIDLMWTETSSNVSSFLVERSADGATFVQIATVAANLHAYADPGLTSATTYWYRMRATNTFGISPYSSTISARTRPH
jgi:hypothetical protein